MHGHNIVGQCKLWLRVCARERNENANNNIPNAITLVCQCILVRIFSTNKLIWWVRVHSKNVLDAEQSIMDTCIFLCFVLHWTLSLCMRILRSLQTHTCSSMVSGVKKKYSGEWNWKKTLKKKKHCPYLIPCCMLNNFDYAVRFRTPNEHFWYGSLYFASSSAVRSTTQGLQWIIFNPNMPNMSE